MKIALIGYGKMGKTIEQIAFSRGHQIVSVIDINNPEEEPIFSKLFDDMHELKEEDNPAQQLIEEGQLFRESTAQYKSKFIFLHWNCIKIS